MGCRSRFPARRLPPITGRRRGVGTYLLKSSRRQCPTIRPVRISW
ncbi:TPA: PanM family protein [Methanopyrus kandleri]|uniref:PanM family protein n=1 Tax=Methanopyrus kandleri TaxID=2320 RepID=A0A832T8Z5_9EURY|nr:PanM family protein [Methanopyrus kandleri]